MKLQEIRRRLNLTLLTPELACEDVEIAGGYASDLLSDVLAHAPRGGVLVTVQVHMNVIAVAVHAELGAVIFAMGRRPDPAVCGKAVQEKIPLLVSSEPAFELAGKLYQLGVGGSDA